MPVFLLTRGNCKTSFTSFRRPSMSFRRKPESSFFNMLQKLPDSRLSGNNTFCNWLTRMVLILFFSLMGFTGAARAEEMVLPESGIRYPGGFDPNTVGEIRGKAFGFSFPERGPVSFKVASPKETYTVLASPFSTWAGDARETVKEGSEVRVLGSKTLGADGRLYLIAQEIENQQAGKRISIRTERGMPLWERPATTRNPETGSSTRWLFNRGGGNPSRGAGGVGGGGRGGSGGGGGGGGGGK